MDNTSYARKGPAEAYDNIWNYSPDSIERLAEIIHAEYPNDIIFILDIGIGTGSLTLEICRFLVEKNNRKVVLDGFDSSEYMLDAAKARLDSYSPATQSCITATFIKFDAKKGIPDEFDKKFYQVIIITFLLHYLNKTEWESLLEKAIDRLQENGILIQGEVVGEMGAVDGLTPVGPNGRKIESNFVTFWEEYFEHRDQMSAWKPDLRPSSYHPVFTWIAGRRDLIPMFGFCSSEIKNFFWADLLKWISDGVFSSLSAGLPPQKRIQLENILSQWVKCHNLAANTEILRSVRFQTHVKSKSNKIASYVVSRSLQLYEEEHEITSLDFIEDRLPITDNFPKLNDTDINSTLAFLDQCVVPMVGASFFDCEFILRDFLRPDDKLSNWATISRIRPEFLETRNKFTNSLVNLDDTFIDVLYRTKDLKGATVLIKSSNDATTAKRLLRNKWITDNNLNQVFNNIVDKHRALAPTNEEVYIYYITTLFIRKPRESADGEEFGAGGLILLCANEIAVETLVLLRHVAELFTNPIGSAYLRAEQIRQTRKSARAAVFARNFSHITGSHVISNPEFRHSLVGEDLMRGFRKRLGESHRGFVDAENDLFRFMLEKAYKVEDLWTAGTKVLADAREEMGTGGRLMENTRRFHEYLQGRFDFIARAIDDTQDQPEPMWFVKDLVEGFLSQTAYLDTLVADVGLRRDDMQFVIKLPDGADGSATFQAEWKPDPRTEALMVDWKAIDVTSGKIGDHATLVALPGGMVSSHAFYSLLENIIRNSAKYGSLKEDRQKAGTPYRITLELSRGSDDQGNPKQHFDLRIWDNYSSTKKKRDGTWEDQLKPLQKRLEQDFVKSSGEQATENLGMMEMQACAQMLYRGEKMGIYLGDKPSHVCTDETDLEARKTRAASFNIWTDEENDDRKADGHFLLTYHLTMNVPVLLAALTAKTAEGSLSYRTNSLEKVRKNWPHLLILDGTANGEGDQWLADIARNPEAVPYRTLVLCKDESGECTNNWKGKIEGNGLKKRVRLLGNKDLYELIFAVDNSDKETEKAAILAAYEAWLRAWKGKPTGGQWHLWIGMERPVDQVKEAWENNLKGFNNGQWFFGDKKADKSIFEPVVLLGVRSFMSGSRHDFLAGGRPFENAQTEESYWKDERTAPLKDKRALVFDNHGNCFPGAYEAEKVTDLENGTRFYQKLSGTVSPDLFHTLSRPPADEFGFAFFIYSLVESCLTNIAVVDERVAWNLIEGGSGGAKNDHFAEHLAEHQKAGVFPVFRFRQEGAGTESGFYNATHRELVKRCVSQTGVLDSEGVVFDTDVPTKSKVQFLRTAKKGDVSSFESVVAKADSPFAPDVLLIHEGAMDILTSEQGVKWEPREDGKGSEVKYLKALYALAPATVRTSGRGRKSKLLGEHLPFIEFGEVSSALLTARNKFSLVRGLLGSAGTER